MAEHASGRRGLFDAAPRRSAGAILLLALAVIFFALYLIADGGEHHSFNSDHSPPATVHITQGKQYEISTPDGVPGLRRRGLDPTGIACNYQANGAAAISLQISPLGASTRTVHAVATFVAPVTGDVHIECNPLTAGTFVDNADNGAVDPAGLFLLLCTITAGLGVPLALSWLYARSTNRLRKADEGDEQPTESTPASRHAQ